MSSSSPSRDTCCLPSSARWSPPSSAPGCMPCTGPWPCWAPWAPGTCCCCSATAWASTWPPSRASPGSVLVSAWPASPPSRWTPSSPGRGAVPRRRLLLGAALHQLRAGELRPPGAPLLPGRPAQVQLLPALLLLRAHHDLRPLPCPDPGLPQVSQVEPVRREGELWRIRAQAGLSVVSIVAVDIFFHFFYILTIPSDLKFANRLPDSALAGLAYSNLVYDWVKAAVLFGVVNTVARLDHLDPPQAPKCITALYLFSETHFDRGINDWLCKYVYDYIGGEHSEVIPELVASVATFAVTTLWLGPCDIVYLWSLLNCFGLNFELWVLKLAEWGPLARIEATLSEQMSRRIRAFFGAINFWAIIMYNLVSLNSLEFTELVARRLLLTGFPQTTLAVLFVTYCGVQLVKERERTLALEEERQDKEKPE
ncbi:protein-cysteine N-palmitoyltransferase HHAT-like protein isoform X3 [Sorex araneus]|uniref:protein-cysteine N-palmitoyltransferase HHAT-like protein isoform X3 n=1 Tax=Sorex araneus TaxID=42254 RepID=UPI0024338F2C|nr:protein-cysteine N-palmitoyltransferase HHAT-like protein isoform X3 [Sorex araneus]XP_054992929.1 protein-cysteine N-palmitoyltransferase HHAT-like protein isoform X3 [Sorex araneus]